ncbi:GlxA family transcriptional regulator [Burkholderia multivorans]|uniref:GlxA family transcriptional regulator n=1 Tax=Burkholderia multivorans TaxID=87883 RepID=UPI000277F6D6|nr:GlxA family transcriptional regulator [Burkholderia multivorans]AJY19400.1 helix-turn-helix domain protein [Burkholderia multivorans ATCC BAA-247]AVR23093.1 GlxA family transcriptional regulator [Burkholderia multivorans]EJO53252.1 DNA-binding helix-turn-helix protein [Burkholderia multivorans ATCC BAA-247]MBU9497914.1 GlxA family transcriptional regulator [Burkholderia multivorans]MCO1436561.1 GlxA family transcriptional regulator [Burkholderia multivorans]
MSSPRPILILAFPRAQLLDVSGPLQVFASVNELALERGRPALYVPRIVAADAGPVETSSGVAVVADSLRSAARGIDTLIVAGGKGVHAASRDARLVRWVRRQADRARRVASVCTGAFLLAEAGLLDGRRAVTHWTRCDELAARYPNVRVEADPIFIREGALWTSAGVTAGIDLALALVEEDLGRAVALDVARELVVFLKRPGGQAQFSAMLSMQRTDDRFGELHAWIAEHLSADLSVPALAERARMSERSFVRHYRASTGRTPARAVEQIRVEAAQRLLGETGWPVKRIAARCGFGSEETLRRSFVRVLGVSPQEYRERFVR